MSEKTHSAKKSFPVMAHSTIVATFDDQLQTIKDAHGTTFSRNLAIQALMELVNRIPKEELTEDAIYDKETFIAAIEKHIKNS